MGDGRHRRLGAWIRHQGRITRRPISSIGACRGVDGPDAVPSVGAAVRGE